MYHCLGNLWILLRRSNNTATYSSQCRDYARECLAVNVILAHFELELTAWAGWIIALIVIGCVIAVLVPVIIVVVCCCCMVGAAAAAASNVDSHHHHHHQSYTVVAGQPPPAYYQQPAYGQPYAPYPAKQYQA